MNTVRRALALERFCNRDRPGEFPARWHHGDDAASADSDGDAYFRSGAIGETRLPGDWAIILQATEERRLCGTLVSLA